MRDIESMWDPKYQGRIASTTTTSPRWSSWRISRDRPGTLTEADLPAISDRHSPTCKIAVGLTGDVVTTQTALATGEVDIIFGGGEFVTAVLEREPGVGLGAPRPGHPLAAGDRRPRGLGEQGPRDEVRPYIVSEGQASWRPPRATGPCRRTRRRRSPTSRRRSCAGTNSRGSSRTHPRISSRTPARPSDARRVDGVPQRLTTEERSTPRGWASRASPRVHDALLPGADGARARLQLVPRLGATLDTLSRSRTTSGRSGLPPSVPHSGTRSRSR